MPGPPRGYDELIAFPYKRRIPLGSFNAWVRSCYHTLCRTHNYACTWEECLGGTVAMIRRKRRWVQEFVVASRNSLSTEEQKRFLRIFCVLAVQLAGGSQRDLEIMIGRLHSQLLHHELPTHPQLWPIKAQHFTTHKDVRRICIPYRRPDIPLMGVLLNIGYWEVSRDRKSLDYIWRAYQLRRDHPQIQSQLRRLAEVFREARQYFEQREEELIDHQIRVKVERHQRAQREKQSEEKEEPQQSEDGK